MSIKNNLKSCLKTGIKVGAVAGLVANITKPSNNTIRRLTGLGLALTTLISTPTYAMDESSVQAYIDAMDKAANNQNIGQIANLVSDDAIISLTRQGKTANLDKNGYLQLLQKSWAKATNYHYDIHISDVVVAGNQARAQVTTTETWIENNKPVEVVTTSRVTLSQMGAHAVLLRSVAQFTIK